MFNMLVFRSGEQTQHLLIHRLSKAVSESYISSMDRELDYLKNSEWCLQLALAARSKSEHIMLVHIAETWRRLADDARAVDLSPSRTLH